MLGRVLRGIDLARDGYTSVVTRGLRKAWIGLAVIAAFAVAAGVMAIITPSGFLPNEDQGAIFAQITLPPGASVNRTEAVADGVVKQLEALPQVSHVMSVIGISILDAATQSDSFFPDPPKPFADRPGVANNADTSIRSTPLPLVDGTPGRMVRAACTDKQWSDPGPERSYTARTMDASEQSGSQRSERAAAGLDRSGERLGIGNATTGGEPRPTNGGGGSSGRSRGRNRNPTGRVVSEALGGAG